MKFKILAHGNTSPDKVQTTYKIAKFYAKYLNIIDFNYKVFVCIAPNMRKKDGNNGVCAKTGDREITIAIDSTLELAQMLCTLAHEMVHVKQYVRGQYRATPSRNGKLKKLWLGKSYSVQYHKRPWEIEAFGRECELVDALLSHLVNNKLR